MPKPINGEFWSWEDLERRALHDAILQAVVTRVRHGDDKESALIGGLITCSWVKDEFVSELTKAFAAQPVDVAAREALTGYLRSKR
jgi:hypothetical protein